MARLPLFPLGKHAAPQSPADNADVLPIEAAHTETHLKGKNGKCDRNSCMNLWPIYFNDVKMGLAAQWKLLSAV